MYTYVFIYLSVYLLTDIRKCIYVYTAHTKVCVYMCVYMYVCISGCIHTRTQVHVCMYACMRVCLYICMRASMLYFCMHATCTHVHAHTHTHTQTHMCMCISVHTGAGIAATETNSTLNAYFDSILSHRRPRIGHLGPALFDVSRRDRVAQLGQ